MKEFIKFCFCGLLSFSLPLLAKNEPSFNIDPNGPSPVATLPFLKGIAKKLPWPGMLECQKSLGKSRFFKKKPPLPTSPANTVIHADFVSTLHRFAGLMRKQMSQQTAWFHHAPVPPSGLYNPRHSAFVPFVQKKAFAKGAQAAIWGDLHGGFHSLINTLSHLNKMKLIDANLKIKSKNFNLIFLGDYVDRGYYGVEVLYVLMQLKLKNPDQVFLVRGNHEDLSMNSADELFGSFYRELKEKFGLDRANKLRPLINRFYNLLPLAFYIAHNEEDTKPIQCCHGGIDLHYHARPFLQDKSSLATFDYLDKNRRLADTVLPYINPAVVRRLASALIAESQKIFFENFRNSAHAILEGDLEIMNHSFQRVFQREQTQKLSSAPIAKEFQDILIESQILYSNYKEAVSARENNFTAIDDLSLTATNISKIEEIVGESRTHATKIFYDGEGIEQKHTHLFGTIQVAERPDFETTILYFMHTSTKNKLYLNFNLENAALIKDTLLTKIFNPRKQILAKNSEVLLLAGLSPGIIDDVLFRRFHQPSELPLLSFGMVWHDAAIDPAVTFSQDFSTGRREFGRDITKETLKFQGASAIFRGHQHHGKMIDLLAEHRGVVPLWRDEKIRHAETVSLEEGDVFTFQVAHSSGAFANTEHPHEYDPFGILTVGDAAISSWTLQKVRVPHKRSPLRQLRQINYFSCSK